MELVMGQFSGRGPTAVWNMNPSAKGKDPCRKPDKNDYFYYVIGLFYSDNLKYFCFATPIDISIMRHKNQRQN
jgi:hypothetical protein